MGNSRPQSVDEGWTKANTSRLNDYRIIFILRSVSICLYRDAGNVTVQEEGRIEEPAKQQGRQQVKQNNNVLTGPV
jgi:hypothetical protein